MSSDSDTKNSNFTGILRLYPEYRKLWSAQAVNNIGNQFTFIALQFLVYNLTESTVAMGILAICQTISMITLGPYIGALVDRYDRKKIMVRSNIAQAIWLFAIPLTRFLPNRVIWIFMLAFLMGATNRFFFPSRASSIPKLVSKDDLLAANSLSMATYQISAFVGPVTAGFLIARIGYDFAFIIDMIGFLISAFFIQKIMIDLKPEKQGSNVTGNGDQPSSAQGGVKADLKEAYVFLKGYLAMVFVIILFAFAMFGLGSSMILMIPFLDQIRNPISAEEAFGVMNSLAAITGLTIAIILGRKNKLSLPLTLMSFASVLAGIMMIGFSTASNVYILAFYWMFFGMLEVMAMIPFQTLAQETIPDILRGKVFALFNLVITSAQIIGMAAGGFLADSIGIRTTFLFSGLVVTTASIIGLGILVVKHFEKDVQTRRTSYIESQAEFEPI